MSSYPFQLPHQTSISIAGSQDRFPVARVLCIGRNYPWPGDKNAAPAQMPSWFIKPAQTVVAADGALTFPHDTDEFCHEIELVVAIGKAAYRSSAEELKQECIWGYAAGLDMTRRDLQLKAKQTGGPWTPAKVFEAAAPCSPIVPVQSIGHPQKGAIWLSVNGAMRQRADLSEMLFGVPDLLAMLSQSLRLLPGDLVFTGTPSGVGSLSIGDTIEAGIDGVATFTMHVAESLNV